MKDDDYLQNNLLVYYVQLKPKPMGTVQYALVYQHNNTSWKHSASCHKTW